MFRLQLEYLMNDLILNLRGVQAYAIYSLYLYYFWGQGIKSFWKMSKKRVYDFKHVVHLSKFVFLNLWKLTKFVSKILIRKIDCQLPNNDFLHWDFTMWFVLHMSYYDCYIGILSCDLCCICHTTFFYIGILSCDLCYISHITIFYTGISSCDLFYICHITIFYIGIFFETPLRKNCFHTLYLYLQKLKK